MPHQFDPFQIGNRFQVGAPEKFEIFLDDTVAKGMKSINRYPVRLRPDHFQQALAHCVDAGIGKSETKNILRPGIRVQQDFTDAGGQDVRFACAGAGDYQNGTFRLVHRKALGGVEACEKRAEIGVALG